MEKPFQYIFQNIDLKIEIENINRFTKTVTLHIFIPKISGTSPLDKRVTLHVNDETTISDIYFDVAMPRAIKK
jgi:hypothetical protein